ncbi:hypothetical protein DFH06DRAFT_1152821 [Mycena polygramma]|nr:hypothetical protein DFH06DRAFT_1152821 [Mycena polygramma]
MKIYPSQRLAILQQAQNLMHCRLEVCDEGDLGPGPDITLPCLESLILDNPDSDKVPGYLETLILPALRHLEVEELLLEPNPVGTLTADKRTREDAGHKYNVPYYNIPRKARRQTELNPALGKGPIREENIVSGRAQVLAVDFCAHRKGT